MTTDHPTPRGPRDDPPPPVPPAGARPPGRGAGPGSRRVGPSGIGVVGLWLSVIVLLPLAALTVAVLRRRARPVSGMR